MDILHIPFHALLQMKEATNKEHLYEMEEQPSFLNHLGTYHACVQLALAEASAGAFLLKEFAVIAPQVAPMVRKTEAKYHKPANGLIQSKAQFISLDKAQFLENLHSKGRAQLQVKAEIFDASNTKVLTAIFDWFVVKV